MTVEVRGRGPASHTLGHDQLKVTVIPDPQILVNAGETQEVYVGDQVTLTGSFTRPRSVSSARYEWDPGDGSDPIMGQLGNGQTRATVQHTYQDPRNYRAILRINAGTLAGEVTRQDAAIVIVQEKPGYAAAGVDLGNAVRNGTRGLTWSLKAVLLLIIWTAIFLPLWGPAAGAFWWLRRRKHLIAQDELLRARIAGPETQE